MIRLTSHKLKKPVFDQALLKQAEYVLFGEKDAKKPTAWKAASLAGQHYEKTGEIKKSQRQIMAEAQLENSSELFKRRVPTEEDYFRVQEKLKDKKWSIVDTTRKYDEHEQSHKSRALGKRHDGVAQLTHEMAVNKYFKKSGNAMDNNSYATFFEGSYFSERAGKDLSVRSSRVFLHYMMQVTLDTRAKFDIEQEIEEDAKLKLKQDYVGRDFVGKFNDEGSMKPRNLKKDLLANDGQQKIINFEIPRFQKYDLLPAGWGVCGAKQRADEITMNVLRTEFSPEFIFTKLGKKSQLDEDRKEHDRENWKVDNKNHREIVNDGVSEKVLAKPKVVEDVFVKYCKIEDYNDRRFWESFEHSDWKRPPNLVEVYQNYVKGLEDETRWLAF